MNLRSCALRRWLSASAFTCAISFHAFAQLPSQSAILSVMSSVNNYWTQGNSAGSNNNDWDGSVYMIGDVDAYAATGDSSYLSYAESWASGNGYGLIDGNSTRDANYQAAGEVYVRLYQYTGNASDITNINADVDAMVKASSSGDWTWVDALNMAMPVFAQLSQINNSSAYSAEMYSEFSYTKSKLYNSSKHLWWRDSTFVGSNTYWSRGNAWAFVALAKVLGTLPTSDPNYSVYLSTFQAMASELLTLQQSDGFWYASLTDPSEYPTPETSGTAGFTYGMAWGINAGVLDSSTYLPAVTNAWNGMVATAVHSNGFLGYVQGEGTEPSSGQPVTSNSTADFGVGLFLEAGSEVVKLAGSGPSTPVATPTFSPAGGSYTSAQTVSISDSTSGATIYYTTNGDTPTTSSTIYSGPISVSSTKTIEALGVKSGLTNSSVASATYTIGTSSTPQVATPTLSPAGGSYTSAQTVSISDSTSGATIYYTTNGNTPTTSSTVYSGPISVSSTTTIEALGAKSGDTNSNVASATYTIGTGGGGPVDAPAFSEPAGTYSKEVHVRITDATSGATIYYTTNGTTPSATNGTVAPNSTIELKSTTTLEAIAILNGQSSSVTSATYTID